MSETYEARKKIFDEYYGGGREQSSLIIRSFLNYNRYFEADWIIGRLKILFEKDVKGLKVLDFGCGVGDYGLSFLREGSDVTFYDIPYMIDFAKFRVSHENLTASFYEVPTDFATLFKGKDVAIFGEVLEHLDNPAAALQACVDNKVQFVFSSSYPYRDDEAYFHKAGHSLKAWEQEPECKQILESNYDYIVLEGQVRLWSIKK